LLSIPVRTVPVLCINKAIKVAAESLIAQINSQSKPRNYKNYKWKRNLKNKLILFVRGSNLRPFEWHQRTSGTWKSLEIITLSVVLCSQYFGVELGSVWESGIVELWGPFPSHQEEHYYLITIWDPVSRLGFHIFELNFSLARDTK
jgi:hypothetical protein